MRKCFSRIAVAALAVTGICLVLPVAGACPFCVGNRGPTLIGDFNQSKMVLVGDLVNATLSGGGGLENGTTDFKISDVLKDHDVRKKKNVIALPRYLPNQRNKFLLFCDVFRGVIDPYRGVEVQPKSDLVQYLKGAVRVNQR